MVDEAEELTAYHEAGHAIVSLLLGGRVRMVTIAPDRDDGPERYGNTEVLWRRASLDSRRMAQATIQVCLAGPVVEMIYSGDPYHPGLIAQWSEDWRSAWAAAAQLEPDKQRRLRLLESETASLLERLSADDMWAAISALADHLLAHETLEAEEVDEIVGPWLS